MADHVATCVRTRSSAPALARPPPLASPAFACSPHLPLLARCCVPNASAVFQAQQTEDGRVDVFVAKADLAVRAEEIREQLKQTQLAKFR